MRIAAEEVTEDTRIGGGSHITEIDVDGLALLVDEQGGRGHALNSTGTLVWRLLPHASRLGDLIDDLTAAFGQDRAVIADGVLSLVRNLGVLGFLDDIIRSLESVPIDIEFVAPDDCEEPSAPSVPSEVSFDSRYLATPPNY